MKNADKTLFKQITEQGVIADWREPDVIRAAPTPLVSSDAPRRAAVSDAAITVFQENAESSWKAANPKWADAWPAPGRTLPCRSYAQH